jgi:hypothetical protein
MMVTDLDWRKIIKEGNWSRADVIFLRSICDEALAEMPIVPRAHVRCRIGVRI